MIFAAMRKTPVYVSVFGRSDDFRGKAAGFGPITSLCVLPGLVVGPGSGGEDGGTMTKAQSAREKAKCEIYFVEEKVCDSIADWIRGGAGDFGVSLLVVEGFPAKLRQKLVQAQESRNKKTGKKQALEDRLRKEMRNEIEIQYRLSREA